MDMLLITADLGYILQSLLRAFFSLKRQKYDLKMWHMFNK